MQQLDQMDIAGQKIGVKIAPMSAGEVAANAARLDLDDEGDSRRLLAPNPAHLLSQPQNWKL